jgi:Prokaryotic N-terminal methylation motif
MIMDQRSNNESRSGQTLIEAMVAVTLLTVGFLGISSLLSQSLALNRVTANQLTATYLAAEGIEVAKNLIDHDVYLQIATQGTIGWDACWQKLGGYSGGFGLDYTTVNCDPGAGQIFDGNGGLYYHADTHLYDYNEGVGGGTQTDFKRKVAMTPTGNYEMTVTSVVSWPGFAGTEDEVTMEDHFYNYGY